MQCVVWPRCPEHKSNRRADNRRRSEVTNEQTPQEETNAANGTSELTEGLGAGGGGWKPHDAGATGGEHKNKQHPLDKRLSDARLGFGRA